VEDALKLVWISVPLFLKGMGYTILLSVGSMFFGLALGFGVALMRLSTSVALRRIAGVYISFIRGTPALVQLFLLYYGLAQYGLKLDPIPAALIGLSLNVGGYTAEILRAAIASIDRGQWEASAAIGMNAFQTMTRTVLPQAMRVALPPLGNSFISLVKDTSLAATIQVPELFRQAQLISSRTFEVFTMYVSVAVIYWILSEGLARWQADLERRVTRHLVAR
jgi:cystine transport system permease protein